MGLYEIRDSLMHFIPELVRCNGTELASRNFNRDIQIALMPDIHNHRIRM